jgi:hypothetical protein
LKAWCSSEDASRGESGIKVGETSEWFVDSIEFLTKLSGSGVVGISLFSEFDGAFSGSANSPISVSSLELEPEAS